MDVEKEVAAYYTGGRLEEKILGTLRSAGKDLTQLRTDDFVAIDDLHVGGREAIQELAGFMGLRPDMHLLDVGCGIGGPARYFAERGCQVTGIDLTDEFVHVAEVLTRLVKLDNKVRFRQASALELPFDDGSFDGAYQVHVGMNIADKVGVFREVARVLRRGGRFAIFDIMRKGDGRFDFPVPWARSSDTSFVASAEEYRQALEAAGFRIERHRERRQFAIEFMQKMMARAASASSDSPALGVQLMMGEQAPVMLKNVLGGFVSGALEPVELVGIIGD
jgi:ubiquinone/menaquinone biosynthesis C-methylase UbiE